MHPTHNFLKSLSKKEKNMTFQFSTTNAIADQIAQLQEQLNQLVASLKPLQECQQKAEELRSQVAEFGSEMAAKGIPQLDIIRYAKALYSAVSGTELVDSGSDAISAAAIAPPTPNDI
jgi:hypothetical protein